MQVLGVICARSSNIYICWSVKIFSTRTLLGTCGSWLVVSIFWISELSLMFIVPSQNEDKQGKTSCDSLGLYNWSHYQWGNNFITAQEKNTFIFPSKAVFLCSWCCLTGVFSLCAWLLYHIAVMKGFAHVLTEKEQPVDWVKSDLNLQDYSAGIRLRLEHPKVISSCGK